MDTELLLGVDIRYKRPLKEAVAEKFSMGDEYNKIVAFFDVIHPLQATYTSLVVIALGLVKYKCFLYGEYGNKILAELFEEFSISAIVRKNSFEVKNQLQNNPAAVAKSLVSIFMEVDHRTKKEALIVVTNFLLYFSHLFHIFEGKITKSELDLMVKIKEDGPCIV